MCVGGGVMLLRSSVETCSTCPNCRQVALDAADMVLIRSDLHAVLVALDLAATVFRRIRLNYGAGSPP